MGLTAGIFSGLFGIGGGVVLIPFMVSFLKIEQKKAQGTSLMVIVPLALAASITYRLSGNLHVTYALSLAAGSMIGIYFGSALVHKIPSRLLSRGFGVIVIFAAIRMFFI